MNLLEKKLSELTEEDLREMTWHVGTTALPYPGIIYTYNNDAGTRIPEIGLLADDAHPLAVYSNRSHEYVLGKLYREMAIPSLLEVQQKALEIRAPSSRNRIMLILGKPGLGKTHIVKTIADVCDKRGPLVVDCGDRYMGDLLWEQVIDYGQGFKSALTEKIKANALKPRSTQSLEEEFPDALVKDAKGIITDIDWEKAAKPRKHPIPATEKFETSVQATERVMEIIKKIAAFEDIPTQAVNSVGIKKIPGVAKQAHDQGLSLILDEYTKSEEGSDGSLQNYIQYVNGEIDEVTMTNSMKVDGDERTYSYTLRRDDMRAGFCVYMTGNSEEDGVTTHTLPTSVFSRVLTAEIHDPLPTDWKHTIGRELTGLPESTILSLFPDVLNSPDDKEEFGETLRELRKLGLPEEQRVPEYQMTLLTNWEQTRTAIDQLADLYRFWARIINQDSDLYDSQNTAVYKTEVEEIRPEISGDYASKNIMDFRKVIRDVMEALKERPAVRKIGSGTGLRIQFSAIGKKALVTPEDPDVVASELGSHLAQILYDRICSTTQGKPHLQAALINEGFRCGIFTPDTPKPGQQTISTLLNQDQFKSAGGIRNVTKLRSALISRLKKTDPALQGKPDAQVISMGEAVRACEELAALTRDEEAPRRDHRLIILGKDLSHIFNQTAAVDGERLKERPAPAADELVSVSDFLDSLKIPVIANANLQGIWPRDNARGLKNHPLPDTPRERETYQSVIQALDVTENSHSSNIGLQSLVMQGADGGKVPVHILFDQTRNKALIVTEKADEATKAALSDNFTVITYDDPNISGRISAFVNETLQDPSRPHTEEAVAQNEKALTWAFTFLVSGYDANSMHQLASMMSQRESAEHHIKTPVYLYKNVPRL